MLFLNTCATLLSEWSHISRHKNKESKRNIRGKRRFENVNSVREIRKKIKSEMKKVMKSIQSITFTSNYDCTSQGEIRKRPIENIQVPEVAKSSSL